MLISPHSLQLPIILDLLERGYMWEEISETPSLLELYGWDENAPIYPYQLGGSGLTEKLVGELSPFNQYVHRILVDYMLSYIPTTQEAIADYKVRPNWQFLRAREFKVAEMDRVNFKEQNLQVKLEKCTFFFYTYSKVGVTHIKKEN